MLLTTHLLAIAGRGRLLERTAQRRQEELGARLRALCEGRERHSEAVELHAVRISAQRIRITWRDRARREGGRLGYLPRRLAPFALPALFKQLRAWRENAGVPAKAKGAAA